MNHRYWRFCVARLRTFWRLAFLSGMFVCGLWTWGRYRFYYIFVLDISGADSISSEMFYTPFLTLIRYSHYNETKCRAKFHWMFFSGALLPKNLFSTHADSSWSLLWSKLCKTFLRTLKKPAKNIFQKRQFGCIKCLTKFIQHICYSGFSIHHGRDFITSHKQFRKCHLQRSVTIIIQTSA